MVYLPDPSILLVRRRQEGRSRKALDHPVSLTLRVEGPNTCSRLPRRSFARGLSQQISFDRRRMGVAADSGSDNKTRSGCGKTLIANGFYRCHQIS